MAIQGVVGQTISGARLMSGDGPPSAATGRSYAVGDVIVNNSPAAGEPTLWRCVTAGDPGTWEADNGTTFDVVIGPIAAAAAVSQAFPVRLGLAKLKGVSAVFTTTSTSGTLDIEKLTGTTAPGSGTTQLTGTISLSGTANTIVSGTVIASPASFALGDRVGLKFAGTVTGLVGCYVTLTFERI